MILKSTLQLYQFFLKAKTERSIVWDIETTGLVYYSKSVMRYGKNDWEILESGDKIIGHAFLLPSDGSTYYLPVRMNSCENLPVEAVNGVLQQLFSNPELELYAHNGKFDLKFVEKEGVTLCGKLMDTMLLAHCANENETSFALKELGKKYVKFDADVEKLALDTAQAAWVTEQIKPCQEEIERLEGEMTRIEREWKYGLKEDYKYELADCRKQLTLLKKADVPKFQIDAMEIRITTLRGRIEDINRRNPNQHLSVLPPAYLDYKAHREDLMERIAKIKRILPIENLRNLDAEVVAQYAKQDVILTETLRKRVEHLNERQGLTQIAKEICEYGVVIGKIESTGLLMDKNYIHEQIERCDVRQREIESLCHAEVGRIFNLNSHPEIKRITGLASSAREFLEVSEHPIAQLVNEYRQWGRARDTYFKVFLEHLDVNNRLHPNLLLLAVTGRATMKKPSMNTLPRESDIYNVRGAIIAPPSSILVECDLSQAELRLLAHLSGDPNLTRAYNEGIDIHQQTADMIGVSRQVAKRTNFATVYGAGPPGLVHALRLDRVYLYKLLDEMPFGVKDRAEISGWKLFQEKVGRFSEYPNEEVEREYLELGAAKNILDDYKERFPLVERYVKNTIYFAKRHRYTPMWTGRLRRYPDLRTADGRVYNESRTAPNSQIQGGVAEIIRLAMTSLDRKFTEMEKKGLVAPKMLLQVHDSIVFECAEDEHLNDWIKLILRTMSNVAKFRVPMVADCKLGYRWGKLEAWKGED